MTNGGMVLRGLALAAVVGCAGAGWAVLTPTPARAATDCRGDFSRLIAERQASIAKINEFRGKKPTAQAACQALTTLQGREARLLEWVTANKDWCQIPDEVPAGLSESVKHSNQMRGQACGAAANQAKQIAKLKAQQQAQGGGAAAQSAPGSGVKLPQGAL